MEVLMKRYLVVLMCVFMASAIAQPIDPHGCGCGKGKTKKEAPSTPADSPVSK